MDPATLLQDNAAYRAGYLAGLLGTALEAMTYARPFVTDWIAQRRLDVQIEMAREALAECKREVV